MTSIENSSKRGADTREPVPLSLLNDFLFCERRAGLKAVEGIRSRNEHTIVGDAAHEHADLAGYEVAKGTLVWRALPVWSVSLGLNGKCDIVEVVGAGSAAYGSVVSELRTGAAVLRPVEYKKGKRRAFDNDDVQVCAQGLCLEEMFGVRVEGGAIFHAASRRRREVAFTEELREKTRRTAAELHALVERGEVPPAQWKKACPECSLYEICQPEAADPTRASRLAAELFKP